MNKLLLVLLCSVASVSRTQITFDRSDFGSAGDKVIYAVDSPVNALFTPGPAGADRYWYFPTYFTPKRYDSTEFFAATADPNAPGVTANMMMRSVALGDQYMEVTNSFMKVIQNMPEFNVRGIKLKTLTFPFTYQTTFSDSTNAGTRGKFADFGIEPPISGVDSVRIDAKIKVVSVCDGWGTLILPGDTTEYQALRVKTTLIIDAFVDFRTIIGLWIPFGNQVQTNTSYQWYTKNSKSYIAYATLDSAGKMLSFTHRINEVPKHIFRKLVSVTPDSAVAGTTADVLIHARNTYFTQNPPLYVNFYNGTVNSFTVIDDSTIRASVSFPLSTPAGTLFYIQVREANTPTLYLYNSFRITASPIAPKLVSVSPGYGIIGQVNDLTIRSRYTRFTQGNNTISFFPQTSTPGNIYINSFTVVNDTTITCRILIDSNTLPKTVYNVQVSSSRDGYLGLAGAFSTVTTGVNDMQAVSLTVTAYPNPASEELNIFYNALQPAEIILTDITGRISKTTHARAQHATIDISDLQNGIYLMTVSTPEATAVKKVLISH